MLKNKKTAKKKKLQQLVNKKRPSTAPINNRSPIAKKRVPHVPRFQNKTQLARKNSAPPRQNTPPTRQQYQLPENNSTAQTSLSPTYANYESRSSFRNEDLNPQQSPYEFTVALGYIYKADYAEESERLGKNHWDFASEFAYNRTLSVLLAGGFDYITVGNTITEDRLGNTYTMSDTTLGGSWRTLIFGHKFKFSAENAFPTSEESQFEGVQSVFTLEVATPLFEYEDIYMLRNRLAYSYVGNQYEYSPSTQQLNNDHLFGYSIVNDVAIFKFWHLGLNFDVRNAHIINGNWSLKAANSYWTSLEWKYFSAGIKYTSADFRNPRDRDDNLWFQDRQRRIIMFSLGASYTF